jgi:hypothetical protein
MAQGLGRKTSEALNEALVESGGIEDSRELGPADVLKCCWDPDNTSLTIAEVIQLGRRMSKVHFEMILVPEVLIQTRVDPDFYMEKKSFFQNKMRRTMFLAVCGQAALPWIYANTLMPYPCKFGHFLEQESNSTLRERVLAPEGCKLQDFIRSIHGGGVIGVTLVALTLMVMCFIAMLTSAFAKRYAKTDNEKWLNYKRLMWRPSLMLWYFKVSLYMPTLKYVNTANMVPCLYIPPSVLACFTYIALILEVTVLGVINHSVAISCVAAYAMGEMWLHILGVLLAAPMTRQKVMKLAMECFDRSYSDILEKMMREDHLQDRTTYTSMAPATISDLIQMRRLAVRRDLDLLTDRGSAEGTIDDIGVITHLLLEAFGGVYKIDLVTGRVKLEARLGLNNYTRKKSGISAALPHRLGRRTGCTV